MVNNRLFLGFFNLSVDIKKNFALIDLNGNETLDSDEIHEALARLGRNDFTDGHIKKFFEVYDFKGDHKLDFHEFALMFLRVKVKNEQMVRNATGYCT